MTATMSPVGDRCLIEMIIPVDAEAVRAAASKILLVRYERSKPRPTTGIVVAVGNGPLIQESIQVGDQVFFSPHAGVTLSVEGKQLRSLEVQEIISVLRGTADELKRANNPLKADETDEGLSFQSLSSSQVSSQEPPSET